MDKKGRFLRLSIESGGCHGFQYKFDLDTALDPTTDMYKCIISLHRLFVSEFEREGSKLVVDEQSLKLLTGSQVDFSRELIGSAFRVIQNPMAASGCGCGVSFNLANNNKSNV